jgi:hypothetical protein
MFLSSRGTNIRSCKGIWRWVGVITRPRHSIICYKNTTRIGSRVGYCNCKA